MTRNATSGSETQEVDPPVMPSYVFRSVATLEQLENK